MERKKIVLFEENDNCCGCGACMNVCPKGAITMGENEQGFVFPNIDYDKCVSCGACVRVCGYNNPPEFNEPEKTYAVSNNNLDEISKSASGGAFYVFAKYIIENGGYVYGVSIEPSPSGIAPRHIEVSTVGDLQKLQGSKYVQSDTGFIYKNVKKRAIDGDLVLFSGTPCQVAGLKNYLGKDYDNVLLVEIICHGVPSSRLFTDFIHFYEAKKNSKIKQFYFRDKTHGQGYTMKTIFDKNGKESFKIGKGELTAYIRFFSKGLTLRDSCYRCPFAQEKRMADITIGDYWGFAQEYKDAQEHMNEHNGVSCVLCNTAKGISFFNKCEGNLYSMESEYQKICKHNKQLNGPVNKSSDRAIVLKSYVDGGYSNLERLYWKRYYKDKVKYMISSLVPSQLKSSIRRIAK